MKLLNIRASAAAAIIVAGISSHAAIASLSDADTATVDITFVEPLSVSNSLIPVEGLTAGDYGMQLNKVASGTITSSGGTATRHYVAFGAHGALVVGRMGPSQTTVYGKNDSSNTLALSLLDSNEGWLSVANCSIVGVTCASGTHISYSIPDNNVSTYGVYMAGKVNADTYTIQTTAYAYSD